MRIFYGRGSLYDRYDLRYLIGLVLVSYWPNISSVSLMYYLEDIAPKSLNGIFRRHEPSSTDCAVDSKNTLICIHIVK